MRVKKFVGRTINEAVAQMRLEFGREAVVLHTKKVKRKGVLGLLSVFSRPEFEVIGAIDPHAPKEPKGQPQQPRHAPTTPVGQGFASRSTPAEPRRGNTGSLEEGKWPDAVQTVFQKLTANDIDRTIAKDLIQSVLSRSPERDWADPMRIWTKLEALIMEKVQTAEAWRLGDQQKVVVLVGPTGVGKTTTTAKLAANYALVAGASVGLITVDTYRMAAVEQLRTYADIMGVPLKVAYSLAELKDMIDRFADKDLILVDTAGRSHLNQKQMEELQELLQGVKAEVHLVVSATTKFRDLEDIVEYFQQVGLDRVIVTKLDETRVFGVLLHTCLLADAPISYLTNGQSVPEDIEVAEPQKITNLVLGE